ncbi:hypothetical protein SYJ56_06460 [Algoriphagus sp. D3-2-R+10]|uniref:hypothetical protein n=1 Tax=Algoriphagus aurantiacus TaxID=3103948 RepID=UPI002B3D7E67|nr:hypothetical protein [Algoriphagus sp. D3-2-R+10]MEB2774940.1 hypothetical protein [Algoriphagus sp. D3-2-R+10]
MLKFLTYNTLFFLVLMVSLSCTNSGNHQEEYIPILHTDRVKVIRVPETKRETPNSSSRYQVVTYTTGVGKWSFLQYPWEESHMDHPEFEYIFYYAGKDTSGLKEWMSSSQFPYPILFDSEGEFKKANIRDNSLTSISFVVKDGDIIEFSNPSLKNFDEVLTALYDEN